MQLATRGRAGSRWWVAVWVLGLVALAIALGVAGSPADHAAAGFYGTLDTPTSTATVTRTFTPPLPTSMPNLWSGMAWQQGNCPSDILRLTTYSNSIPSTRSIGPSSMRLQNSAGDSLDFPVPGFYTQTYGSYVYDCVVGPCMPSSWLSSLPFTLTADYNQQITEFNEQDNVSAMNSQPPCEAVTPTPSPTPTPSATPDCVAYQWTTRTLYPTTIIDNAMVAQGEMIYSFGGYSTNAYKYDLAADSWTAIAPLPAARSAASAVSDGTYIYIVGGYDANLVPTNTLYRYDPATDSYSTLAPMSQALAYHAAAYLNGIIYRSGGCVSSGGCSLNSYVATVEAYDIGSNSWAPIASLPHAFYLHDSVAIGGYVYVAGGAVPDFGPNQTLRYDPSTDSWSDDAIANLPQYRRGGASAVYNGHWILAGGSVNSSYSTSVISWDPATDTWSQLPDMLPASVTRWAGAATSSGFFAVGYQSHQRYREVEPPCVTPTPTDTGTITPTPSPTGCISHPPCNPTGTSSPTWTPTATGTFTATPTGTPEVLEGHVTWDGPPPQPDPGQELPISLTLRAVSGGPYIDFPLQTTDENGNFTVPVDGLPNGDYYWKAKGPNYLANSGTLMLSGAPLTVVEMGLMLAGDSNGDNLVNVSDFTILKSTFGKGCGTFGYDGRADFNNDCAVTVRDYALLRRNFGHGGAQLF